MPRLALDEPGAVAKRGKLPQEAKDIMHSYYHHVSHWPDEATRVELAANIRLVGGPRCTNYTQHHVYQYFANLRFKARAGVQPDLPSDVHDDHGCRYAVPEAVVYTTSLDKLLRDESDPSQEMVRMWLKSLDNGMTSQDVLEYALFRRTWLSRLGDGDVHNLASYHTAALSLSDWRALRKSRRQTSTLPSSSSLAYERGETSESETDREILSSCKTSCKDDLVPQSPSGTSSSVDPTCLGTSTSRALPDHDDDPNARRRRLPQEAIDIMHGLSYSHSEPNCLVYWYSVSHFPDEAARQELAAQIQLARDPRSAHYTQRHVYQHFANLRHRLKTARVQPSRPRNSTRAVRTSALSDARRNASSEPSAVGHSIHQEGLDREVSTKCTSTSEASDIDWQNVAIPPAPSPDLSETGSELKGRANGAEKQPLSQSYAHSAVEAGQCLSTSTPSTNTSSSSPHTAIVQDIIMGPYPLASPSVNPTALASRLHGALLEATTGCRGQDPPKSFSEFGHGYGRSCRGRAYFNYRMHGNVMMECPRIPHAGHFIGRSGKAALRQSSDTRLPQKPAVRPRKGVKVFGSQIRHAHHQNEAVPTDLSLNAWYRACPPALSLACLGADSFKKWTCPMPDLPAERCCFLRTECSAAAGNFLATDNCLVAGSDTNGDDSWTSWSARKALHGCLMFYNIGIGAVYVSIAVFVIYDWVTTFSQEAKLYWTGHTKALSTALYFANRYIMLIVQICTMYSFAPLSDKGCTGLTLVAAVVNIVALVPPILFSGLRAYALSDNSRLSASISLLLAVQCVTSLVQFKYHIFGIEDPILGCLPLEEAPNTLGNMYANPTNALEDVLAFLQSPESVLTPGLPSRDYKPYCALVIITCRSRLVRRTLGSTDVPRTGLPQVMLRDGSSKLIRPTESMIMTYAVESVLLVLNVVQLVLAVQSSMLLSSANSLVSTFITPLSSILVSHFLLDLQAAYQRTLGMRPEDLPGSLGSVGSEALDLRVPSALGSLAANIDVPGLDISDNSGEEGAMGGGQAV
ncbi:hypothetical protein DICSQDRAFT_130562 [Dichomitus squalens LYAD-421 SS1]|uniref:DUF6533 domain-containing protein n=1 Tax=Dichomitus squalens (strain LYAD-421) TaxID=732165 RepID=R7SHC4_DICSQ|nr:uncharacterized protein DICSQDRAFT_130562 [Dichomitus squalens LYAD-421 SS1]EJF55559.1 hypothetical protein DICSQDRAFT_130562 [Dichomitus squalens LYAD-421 SS1]